VVALCSSIVGPSLEQYIYTFLAFSIFYIFGSFEPSLPGSVAFFFQTSYTVIEVAYFLAGFFNFFIREYFIPWQLQHECVE
jgi:hypothetical protein